MEYITHHGIKGQKWGKRNGPPYPLDYDDHTEEQKKKNPKTVITPNKNENTKLTNKTDLNKITIKDVFQSETFKRAIKIGAACAITYAGYKVLSNGKLGSIIPGGLSQSQINFDAYSKLIKRFDSQYKAIGDDALYISAFESFEEIPKTPPIVSNISDSVKDIVSSNLINPNRKDKPTNPFFDPEYIGSNMNCTFCTTSIIARIRGYNVQASINCINGMAHTEVERWFKGAKFSALEASDSTELFANLSKQPDGSYGNIITKFNDNDGRHSIFYCVENGRARIFDGQLGLEYSPSDFSEKFVPDNTMFARLDNCKFTERALMAFDKVNE